MSTSTVPTTFFEGLVAVAGNFSGLSNLRKHERYVSRA